MSKLEKLFIMLCTLFSVVVIIGNMTYQKFFSLHFINGYKIELSVGALLYPITYMITDLITEIYARDRAIFCIRLAILMNLITVVILKFMNILPTAEWSTVDDATFSKVFGNYSIAFMGSLIACYVSQQIDTRIYAALKNLTKDKYIWLRCNVSTGVSLLVDTALVVGFLTVFGVISHQQSLSLIFNSYGYKLAFTMCGTPLFYGAIYLTKCYLKQEDN
jgi:uncharacterized integral membrane protein (TIGR00697 family)